MFVAILGLQRVGAQKSSPPFHLDVSLHTYTDRVKYYN